MAAVWATEAAGAACEAPEELAVPVADGDDALVAVAGELAAVAGAAIENVDPVVTTMSAPWFALPSAMIACPLISESTFSA